MKRNKMASKYFSMHHRFLAWLGRLTNTIILCPHPVSIGNAAEDYYFGLLKARKEGKKLVILFPFKMPSRFNIEMFDPAILYLESEFLAMKYRSLLSSLFSGIFTIYFIVLNVLRLIIFKYSPIELSGYYWRPLAGQDILWWPDNVGTKFDWKLVRDQDWEKQFSTPLKLSLPKKHVINCENLYNHLGLPKDAWFVSLHVREGGFKKDHNNIRNCTIFNFIEAIKEITKRGGWVIRMGDPTMTKLTDLEQVIDYSSHPIRSAMMDVYLMKECSFFVGTASGLYDLAWMLGKPLMVTNVTEWWNITPKSGDFQIFKHVFSRKDKRFLSLQEWLMRAASSTTKENFSSPDWLLFENSEEEILSLVKERLDFQIGQDPSPIQKEFKKVQLREFQKFSEIFRFSSSDVDNDNICYRIGSRMGWLGDTSTKFLEKNWIKSSRRSRT